MDKKKGSIIKAGLRTCCIIQAHSREQKGFSGFELCLVVWAERTTIVVLIVVFQMPSSAGYSLLGTL